MGLKTFEGELPAIKDIKIAKNYLDKNELKILNNLVSGYFDFAEIMALEHRPVYMMDYVKQLDTILQSTGRPLLKGSGSISHQEAMDKTLAEYRKYQVKTLTKVEEDYLDSINALGKIAKRKKTSNPQPIGFSGILLAKRQNSFYCTYFLHNRNVADTKSPYPIKRLEVIRRFNQKSMVFNQSLS